MSGDRLLETVPGGSLVVKDAMVLSPLGSDTPKSSESRVVMLLSAHGGASETVNVRSTWVPGVVVCDGGLTVKTIGSVAWAPAVPTEAAATSAVAVTSNAAAHSRGLVGVFIRSPQPFLRVAP
jgi:hypothetical protein